MGPGDPSTERRPSDSELVRAAREGDPNSLGLLFERHRPRLYATALAMTGLRPEAEDAVHDAFLTALARFRELRDPAAVGGWLHAIVRNNCLMELRRRHRRASPEDTERCFRELNEEAVIDSRIESRELRDWVWTALGKLPEHLRAAVMLRYFGSYHAYEEIAAILAVPVGTVRSRLFDAKIKLSDLLLASARLGSSEAERLIAERQVFYTEAFKSLYRGGRDAFLSHFAHDLHLVFSSGEQVRGRSHWDDGIDDDLRVGVRLKPERVLASGNLTVLEGTLVNPPEDPFHCPPGIVLVLFQDERQIRRLHLHLAPRPPRSDD